MPRQDMDFHLNKIDELAREIENFVPPDRIDAQAFRAHLAGLLVVTIAATYEACVKEVLITHASNHHVAFGDFAQNNYNKINSKIRVGDLKNYAKLFSNALHSKFCITLSQRKNKINDRLGKNIETNFEQILNWRHSFAHAWINSTTIEEAMITHRLAKRVLYAFDEAFNGR